jgi:hypothetical protein
MVRLESGLAHVLGGSFTASAGTRFGVSSRPNGSLLQTDTKLLVTLIADCDIKKLSTEDTKAMAQKTVSVDYLRDTINKALATSTCGREGREAMDAILCNVLHSTGNYRGFRYLVESEVPDGTNPGIRYDHDTDGWCNFIDTDDTRRHYY